MRKRDAYRARKSALKNKTRPVRSEAGATVARIDALTRNARNTWFALLGLLVFVGITLMSVEHIDFYGIDRATRLPLVNVDVPTRYFFVTAPILTAAFYIYFHLHLIRLWDALGAADSRIGGQPLGDAVMPWLVTDAALHLRNRWRADNCAAPHALDVPATFLNLLLTWGFGLIVLGWLWWLSMSARTFGMTAIACSALLAATGVGLSSLKCLFEKMGPDKRIWQSWRSAPIILIGVVITAFSASFLRTGGLVGLWTPPIRLLAPIDMTGLAIVEKPRGWLPRDIAKADFFADWCKREGADCTLKELSEDQQDPFEKEFQRRREAAIAELRKPQWHLPGHEKPDFRRAQLAETFLAGADLSGAFLNETDLYKARLEGANLNYAHLEGTILVSAQMEAGHLNGAWLQGADLKFANLQEAGLYKAELIEADLTMTELQGADLMGAKLNSAILYVAQLQAANLLEAELNGADLRGALLQGANLGYAQLRGADISGAQLQGANLYGVDLREANLQGARLEEAYLRDAQLEGASLETILLTGTSDEPLALKSTNLSGAKVGGGALRFVDLTGATFSDATDFRNTFLDGSVQMTDEFREKMGSPCQWHLEVLSDEEFFGRWRGWVEANGVVGFVAQAAIQYWPQFETIPPDEGCVWETTPISESKGANR